MTYDYFKIKLNKEKSTLLLFKNNVGYIYGGYNSGTWY